MSIAMISSVFVSTASFTTIEAADTFYYNNESYEIYTSGDYSYIEVENEALITKYNGTAGAVSIPTEIDGMKVTSILRRAFESNSSIQTLIIPSGIKSIGERAFADCSGLQQVLFSSTVTEIGDEAFYYCSYLQKIAFQDDGLKSIGEKAFAYCVALDDVVFPESLESLGGAAFYDCSSLSKIKIVDKITELNAFYYGGIFENCISLSEVEIGKDVKKIGKNTFANTAITKVDIPANVETIEQGAFYNCKELAEVTGGSGLKEIGDYAFYNNTSLQAVTFGKKLITIGTRSFMYNNSLKEIVIPSNVENMGGGCFYGCESLESVDIGNGVTSIIASGEYSNYIDGYYAGDTGAFENCISLTNVTIGNGVKTIGQNAFSGTALQSITIPNNVVTIEDGAFHDCDSLTTVVVGSGVTEIFSPHYYWDKGVFEDCEQLEDVSLGSGLTKIGVDAFASTKLKSLLIPPKVSSIKSSSFYNTEMDNLYFTGAAPELDEYLFGDANVPIMNKIAGKSGYDNLEYDFHEFTPITVKYDINSSDVFTIAPLNQLMAPEGGYVIEPLTLLQLLQSL